MNYFENARRRGGRRTKSYSAKQLAAQAMSRQVFARAKAILAAQGCSAQVALKTAWAEAKGGRAAANPRYGLRMLRTNPSGIEIVEQDGKFHIYMDGEPTGKYYLSHEKAVEKASRM